MLRLPIITLFGFFVLKFLNLNSRFGEVSFVDLSLAGLLNLVIIIIIINII